MEMPDLRDDQVDFGTFEPILYQMEQDEDSEGEGDMHGAEGEVPEGEDAQIEPIPEEEQRNIPQDLQNFGMARLMQQSQPHPPMPQRFRPVQMSR